MTYRNDNLPIEAYIRNIFHYIQYSAEQDTVAYGITSRQGRLLEIIVDGLSAGKEVNRKYLEETAFLKGSSVTSLLNGLESKGFIERNISSLDGRALTISVTPNISSCVLFESVVRQTDCTEKVCSLSHILSGIWCLGVHGVSAGYKSNHATGTNLI